MESPERPAPMCETCGQKQDAKKDFVTIVSGLPRSGTSMMMRMIEAGGMPLLTDNIRQADEDNPLGYYEYEPVKKTKEDASWLEEAAGKAVKMVFQLLYDLPRDRQYRVVFMRRNMDEILASQKAMLDRLGREGGKASDEELAKIFARKLREFEEWVKQWPCFRIIYVDYQEAVHDPRTQAEAVSEFLGGLIVEKMAAAVDPSLYRQRGKP